jgi:hypothetical protein
MVPSSTHNSNERGNSPGRSLRESRSYPIMTADYQIPTSQESIQQLISMKEKRNNLVLPLNYTSEIDNKFNAKKLILGDKHFNSFERSK